MLSYLQGCQSPPARSPGSKSLSGAARETRNVSYRQAVCAPNCAAFQLPCFEHREETKCRAEGFGCFCIELSLILFRAVTGELELPFQLEFRQSN